MMNNEFGSWKESKWSNAEGHIWFYQVARDSQGEFIRGMLVNYNTGRPIRFEEFDISELEHLSR